MYRVLKFGGSSLKDNNTRKSVIKKIKQFKDDKLIVIVSAMGRENDPYSTTTLRSLISSKVTIRESQRIISVGEIISSVILSNELNNVGIKAVSLSSSEVSLQVDDNYLQSVDIEYIKEKCKQYDVVIIPGFQGVDKEGEVVTLEKGDSDYTAVFLAKQLSLNTVSIYSDVSGIYSIDPSRLSSACLFNKISFDQAKQIARTKAQVLCLKAIQVASDIKGFKIKLFSTFLDGEGTTVSVSDSQNKIISISDNCTLIRFEEPIKKNDYPYIVELIDKGVVVKKSDESKIETTYTRIDDVLKVHLIGWEYDIQIRGIYKSVYKDVIYVRNRHRIIKQLHEYMIGSEK